MAADGRTPVWEQRFRAPTRRFPHWSRHAPDQPRPPVGRGGLVSRRTRGTGDRGTRRRLSDEARRRRPRDDLGGRRARSIWFSDPTGDESGRWIAVPVRGRRRRATCSPGAPIGWPDGLAVGRRRRRRGDRRPRRLRRLRLRRTADPAKEIHRDVDQHLDRGDGLPPGGVRPRGALRRRDLVCIEVAQDGDNIHRALRVLDPETGSVVGELADGDGLRRWRVRVVSGRGRSADPHRPRAGRPAAPDDLEPGLGRAPGPRDRPARRGHPGRLVAGRERAPARSPVPRARPSLPATSWTPGLSRRSRIPPARSTARAFAPTARCGSASRAASAPRASAGRRWGGAPSRPTGRDPHGASLPGVAVPQRLRRHGARLARHAGRRGSVPDLPEGARRAELALPRHVVAGRAVARGRGVRGRDGELPRLNRLRPDLPRPHHRQHRLPRGRATPSPGSTT